MKNTIIKSVFALALACSGASCTGNYLEINSNPYEVTEDEMQRKGYAISSYLNAIFGTIISPDVNTTQFTDALLGGTQGGYFADSQNGWKTTISNYNPTNDWTRVFMYSDRIIPVLYSNLMKLNGISEDPIVLSIAKIAKVCAMNRVTDAYGPIPYSEIGISGKIQVPYDTQADVYRQMFDELDEAIEMLTAHSSEVLQQCVHLGILYESLPYHNAVFVGKDENQVARYAFLRGIYDASGKSFKMEQAGSEKAYAFCVPAQTGCRRVAVYEACVDVLAHMTLEQGSRDKYRLELGGISAPKEGQSQRSMKKPQALEHFLSQHPEITEIEVCTDNDFAGRWACEHIRKAYEGSYRIIENLPEIEGADWADMAKMAARTPEKRQSKEVR